MSSVADLSHLQLEYCPAGERKGRRAAFFGSGREFIKCDDCGQVVQTYRSNYGGRRFIRHLRKQAAS